jgi:fructose-1,6-bisphosphatase/inositol monophosphatase family enzyme
MNDRRVRVAKRTGLRECLISTGFPFRPGDAFQTYMQMLGDVMPRCAGVRRPGSAALDLAYVAAGFTDGFFEMGLSPWDVAAGALLVTEAGGLDDTRELEITWTIDDAVVFKEPHTQKELFVRTERWREPYDCKPGYQQ